MHDNIRVMSFDLDGTLTDISFVNAVWLEGIPRLYALKNGVPLADAKRTVVSEYNKVGRKRLEWYDLRYWIEKLGLSVSPKEILSSFQHRIKLFPEVPAVLKDFKNSGFRLVIVTNARREFADLELEKTKIEHYFERVFSATSDFGLIKKTVGVYQTVCRICDISPHEMVHVGDDQSFDFDIPNMLGIMAFYIDRTGEHSGESTVHSLRELSGKIADRTLQSQCKRSC
jgi:HAD superfamily hydrolase (TIGR01493 family)